MVQETKVRKIHRILAILYKEIKKRRFAVFFEKNTKTFPKKLLISPNYLLLMVKI